MPEAVILAAGSASRFGADKLLQPLVLCGVERPLIVHALLPWLAVFERVVVVVRPESAVLRRSVEDALGGRDITWAPCTDAGQGMAHSLACGVAASDSTTGWLIGLADMPCVPEAAIAGVRDAIAGGAAMAAPFHHARRGHPVGFASGYRAELLALHGDSGARQLLERNAALVQRIEIDHTGIFTDIDHPVDLQKLNTSEGKRK